MKVRAGDLRVGDQFQIPRVPGLDHAGMKTTVVSIDPSRMLPDHVRIVTARQKAASHIVVLPNDLEVDILERAGVSMVKCQCTNHMGSRKVAYKSEADALTAIFRRHLRYGEHRVYPCPTQDGRFHITSKKEKVHKPSG